MRSTAIAVFAAAIILAGMQPAVAASTPSSVGMVSFVGASYSRSKATASLSLDWPNARHAKKYEVFMSRSYSMSKARKYTVKSSKITVTKLSRGQDYFFQVRGVNGKKRGKKSKRVGHTTIVRPGGTSGLNVRVMTYNVCSRVCDEKRTTPYPWKPTPDNANPSRQPPAFGRIQAYRPDVIAAQEANYLDTPSGYTRAIYFSAKSLFFKTDRFDIAPPPPVPTPKAEPRDQNTCLPTYAYGQPTGHILLGYHSAGCRYAVWTELVDKRTRKHFLAVNVHTVAGTSASTVSNRRDEMNILLAAVRKTNVKRLPIVFAGDFNSHKNRSPDVAAQVMRAHGFRDAYDLARSLTRQHTNSFNAFKTTPRVSYKWGDHVDHIWVSPKTTYVRAWINGVWLKDSRLVKPIPSDHSPIIVDMKIN